MTVFKNYFQAKRQWSGCLAWLLTLSLAPAFSQKTGPLPSQIIHDPYDKAKMVYNRDRDGDGRLDPFFLVGPGDPEGFLYRGKRNDDGTRAGDQEKLIRKVVKHGGNSIYVIAVRTHGGDAPKSVQQEPEVYPDEQHNPWVDQDPSKGLNGKILAQWETWFAEMDRQGILIYFFIYDDGIKIGDRLGWPMNVDGTLHPGEKAFVQDLVNRFKHHKNLIWCVMEEDQELGREWKAHVTQIARAINEADEYNHIIATHQHGGNVFFHNGDPYITQFALQSDKKVVLEREAYRKWMLDAFKNSGGNYSMVMSEDYVHGKITVPANDRKETRIRNWVAAMSNAYVMILGMDIAKTPEPWLNDCRIMQKFFERSTFNDMLPVEGIGQGTTEYVLANEGYDYILYSSGAGVMGVAAMVGGNYTLTWLDIVTGKIKKHKTTLEGGNAEWPRPDSFGDEVALFVRRDDSRPTPKVRSTSVAQEKRVGPTLPAAQNSTYRITPGKAHDIQLQYSDPDGGPGPYHIEIVSGPGHGVLSGTGNDQVYTATEKYKGTDSFTWKVNDGQGDSNIATITIIIE